MTVSVFDPDLKYLADEWVGTVSWYDKKVKITGETVNRRISRNEIQKASKLDQEMRELVGMEAFSGRKGAGNVSKYDVQMEQGYNPALMGVYTRERQVYLNRWVYFADCHCGNQKLLTAEEIIKRDKAGFGCCGLRCIAPDVRRKIWYLPRLALRLQVLQIRNLMPEILPDEWRSHNSMKIVRSLCEREEVSASIANGKWWLKGVAEKEKIMQYSLSLTHLPDEELFPDSQIHLMVGKWPMTINELCESYELDLDTVLELRMKYDNDTQLMDELLGG